MKSEIIAPIVAATIAAVASIAGMLYSQHATLELEEKRIESAREEGVAKLRIQALSEFAKQFSRAFTRASYILWQVEMFERALTPEHFESYTPPCQHDVRHLPQ